MADRGHAGLEWRDPSGHDPCRGLTRRLPSHLSGLRQSAPALDIKPNTDHHFICFAAPDIGPTSFLEVGRLRRPDTWRLHGKCRMKRWASLLASAEIVVVAPT